MLFSSISSSVVAISPDLKTILNKGVYYTDPDNTPTTCTTSQDAALNSNSTLTLDQEIAQTFIVGFNSSDTDTAKTVVNSNKIGGIFFLSGGDTSKLTKSYFASLNSSTANGKLFIAADDEGGQVSLFSKNTPSALTMGSTLSTTAIKVQGQIVGKAMADAGLTGDLAPVLDIDHNGTPWHSTQRDWSSSPATVAADAGAFSDGLIASGITPVFKHFPGIGSVTSNTDNGSTPPQKLSDLVGSDLKPYQTLLGKSNAAIMLSNSFVQEWGSGSVPVSINAQAVSYLRNTLKFTGPITTDALNALSNYSTPIDTPTAVTDALAAGVDMPLFIVSSANTDATVKAAITSVKTAVASGKISQATIDAAYKNSLALRGISTPTSVIVPASTNVSGSTLSCCVTTNGGQKVGIDTASGNIAAVMNYFIAKGFTPQAAASVIGNWQVESGDLNLQPNTQEHGYPFPTYGWGIAQWSFGRRDAFAAAITASPVAKFYTADQSGIQLAPADNTALLQFELNFAWNEINSSYSSLLTSMSKSTDIISATDTFEIIYEGCSPTNGAAACSVPDREKDATKVYNTYIASGGTATVVAAPAAPVAPPTPSGGDISLTPSPITAIDATISTATCGTGNGGSSGSPLSGNGTILKLPNLGIGQQVYYYNQADPQWKKDGNGYDYQACACGQTSTAMIEATLKNDTKITPVTIYNEVGDSGSQGAARYVPSSCSGSNVGDLVNTMKADGLQTETVQTRGNGGLDPAKVFAELQKGHIMIAHTAKWVGYINHNPTSGHYLVIYGADATGQNFYVANPGSRGDNNQAIPAAGLSDWLDEAYAIWGPGGSTPPVSSGASKPV